MSRRHYRPTTTTAVPAGDATLRIGATDWRQLHGRRDAGPAAADDLAALTDYAARFEVVEVASSFHALPAPSTLAAWRDAVPEQFRFLLTVPRTITHERRLRECGAAMARVTARARNLGARLGALLLRMPQRGMADPVRLATLLHAREPDAAWLFELAGTAWDTPAVRDLLTEHGALVRTHAVTDERLAVNATPGPCHAVVSDGDGTAGLAALRRWTHHALDLHGRGAEVSLVCRRQTLADSFATARRLRQLVADVGAAERERSAAS